MSEIESNDLLIETVMQTSKIEDLLLYMVEDPSKAKSEMIV